MPHVPVDMEMRMTDNKWAMLCKLKTEAFDDKAWVWQRKHDGLRMRADIDAKAGVRLTARSGADKTATFPEIVQALAFTVDWGACPMTLDGEVVSADGLGFQDGIQPRVNLETGIDEAAERLPARYVAFDLLRAYGIDYSLNVLSFRRGMLDIARPPCCGRPWSSDSGLWLFETAKAEGWEGVVGKRLDEPYMPHKRKWLKVKVWVGEDGSEVFKVVGWDDGRGRRLGMAGSFHLEDRNGYVGHVGTGFDAAKLKNLSELVKTANYQVYFKVKYLERTNAGRLRLPVYLGLGTHQEFLDAK